MNTTPLFQLGSVWITLRAYESFPSISSIPKWLALHQQGDHGYAGPETCQNNMRAIKIINIGPGGKGDCNLRHSVTSVFLSTSSAYKIIVRTDYFLGKICTFVSHSSEDEIPSLAH